MASQSNQRAAAPSGSPSNASSTTQATSHTHSLAAFDRSWTPQQKQALLKPLNTTLIIKHANNTEHKLGNQPGDMLKHFSPVAVEQLTSNNNELVLTNPKLNPSGLETVLNWMRANCNSPRNVTLDPSGKIVEDIATFHALSALGMPHADHFFTSLLAMVGNRFLSAEEINAVWASFEENPKMAKHLIHNVAHKVFFQYEDYKKKDWLNIEKAIPNDLCREINQVAETFGAREGIGAVGALRDD